MESVKKCVYLCITAINFAEISASSGMFRHLGFRIQDGGTCLTRPRFQRNL